MIGTNALMLAIFNALNGFMLCVLLIAETIGFYVAFAGKYGITDSWQRLRSQAASFKNKDSLLVLMVILIITSVFAIVLLCNVSLVPSALYYVSQGKLISEMHTLPDKVFEWGAYRNILSDKIMFNLFTASLIEITDFSCISIMKFMPLVVVFITLVGAYLFYRQLFNFPLAICGLFLTFMNPIFARFFLTKFLAFRGEAFGVMFLFFFLFSFSRAFFQGDKRFLLLSVLTLVTLGLWHGVAFLIALMILLSFYISRWIVNLRVYFKDIVTMMVVVFAVFIGIFAVLWIGKANSFNKVAKNALLKDDSIALYKGEFDPTWEFVAKLSGAGHRQIKSNRLFYRSPENIFQEMIRIAAPFSWKIIKYKYFLIPIILISGLFIAYLLSRSDKKSMVVLLAFVIFGFELYILALFFSYNYTTYIPAEHVMLREIRYISLVSIIVALFFFAYCKQFFMQKNKAFVCTALLIIVCGYLFFVGTFYLSDYKIKHQSRSKNLSDDGYHALKWIEANTEKESIILSNVRTTGSIYLLAKRRGIMEGRAAYIESDILRDALVIMDEVERFYSQPYGEILDKYKIDYVVFAPRGGLGGQNILPSHINKRALDKTSLLQKAKTFGDIDVYRVIHRDPD
ncbi:hypothetical protein ACFL5X_02335 [Candidatus Omnitrophota bacterium]